VVEVHIAVEPAAEPAPSAAELAMAIIDGARIVRSADERAARRVAEVMRRLLEAE
jgi:hypothetical protein